MRSGDRHCQCPMIGVDIAHQAAARHNLIVEDHLAVVAGIDARQFVVTRFQHGRDVTRLREGNQRIVVHLGRQPVLRQPALARCGSQAVDRATVARIAGRTGKVPQQVRLVLLGIVGQRRAADRAGCADHCRHAAADFRVSDHRFENVGRALRIADQDEARRSGFGWHRHDRVAYLPGVVCGTR
ncbi:hypothetical protein D3C85_1280540 [compost metagenome]